MSVNDTKVHCLLLTQTFTEAFEETAIEGIPKQYKQLVIVLVTTKYGLFVQQAASHSHFGCTPPVNCVPVIKLGVITSVLKALP